MHRAPQGAGSLAVDDPYLQYPQFVAFLQIIRNQGFDILGRKGVQIKNAVDGNGYRWLVVHHIQMLY